MVSTSGRNLGGKIPSSIGIKGNSPFVLPRRGEGWKVSAKGECLYTCTISTGEPNKFARENHTPDAGHPRETPAVKNVGVKISLAPARLHTRFMARVSGLI
jgi:hypothetical protein